jgi:hypothetical protein
MARNKEKILSHHRLEAARVLDSQVQNAYEFGITKHNRKEQNMPGEQIIKIDKTCLSAIQLKQVLPKDERKTSAGYLFLRGGGGAYRFY